VESYLQGRGTYEWVDGRKYEGEWLKDEMHGSGVYTWPDKRKYVGEFQKGKKHGWGTLEETAGTYVGEWVNGLKHGKGTYTYKDDNRIIHGIWKENVLEQINQQIDPNAEAPEENADQPGQPDQPPAKEESVVEEPELPKPEPKPQVQPEPKPVPRTSKIPFSDASEEDRIRALEGFTFPKQRKLTDFASKAAIDKRKEIGPFPFSSMESTKLPYSELADIDDQTLYRGEFNPANLRHGRGICLSQGAIYEGAWEEDKPHGLGRKIDPQGGVLLGYWALGDPHGFAVFRGPDETIYSGEWVKGEREGLGYEHGDLITYKGHYKAGFKHGFGRLEMPRVGVYVGMLEKDLREGFGLMTTLEGVKYVGGWREDRKEGKGVLSQKDGLMLTGKFTDDLQNQVVTRRYLKEELDTEKLFILERKSVGANAPSPAKHPSSRSSSEHAGDRRIESSPPHFGSEHESPTPASDEEEDRPKQADPPKPAPPEKKKQPAPQQIQEERPKQVDPPKSLFSAEAKPAGKRKRKSEKAEPKASVEPVEDKPAQAPQVKKAAGFLTALFTKK
jgi:hypothetical protein